MTSRISRVSTISPTNRMEAFSDGVFGIAITLLVLEIRVPNPAMGPVPHSLAMSLLVNWPAYLAYLISFVTVGIYWVNHHYLVRLFRGTDHALNLLNLFLLMWICLLPFPTAVLSEYMLTPHEQRLAVMLYIGGLLAPALAWDLMWVYATWGGRLVDPELEPEFVRFLSWQYAISAVVYPAALLVAWWNYLAGLLVCVLITTLYLFPSRTPVYREKATAGAGPA